jgi:hypothetical protein
MRAEEFQELLAGFQAAVPVLEETEQLLATDPIEHEDKKIKAWSKVWSQNDKVSVHCTAKKRQ